MSKHRKKVLPPHPNLPNWKPFVYQPPTSDPQPVPERALKILSPRMARKITAAYHCAACWSPLIVHLHFEGVYKGQYTIECDYCGADTPGFVTRAYIAWRIEQNEEEYRQAKIALEAAYPYWFNGAKLHEPKERLPISEEENIRQLGY